MQIIQRAKSAKLKKMAIAAGLVALTYAGYNFGAFSERKKSLEKEASFNKKEQEYKKQISSLEAKFSPFRFYHYNPSDELKNGLKKSELDKISSQKLPRLYEKEIKSLILTAPSSQEVLSASSFEDSLKNKIVDTYSADEIERICADKYAQLLAHSNKEVDKDFLLKCAEYKKYSLSEIYLRTGKEQAYYHDFLSMDNSTLKSKIYVDQSVFETKAKAKVFSKNDYYKSINKLKLMVAIYNLNSVVEGNNTYLKAVENKFKRAYTKDSLEFANKNKDIVKQKIDSADNANKFKVSLDLTKLDSFFNRSK